jgi:hypothetical protein
MPGMDTWVEEETDLAAEDYGNFMPEAMEAAERKFSQR